MKYRAAMIAALFLALGASGNLCADLIPTPSFSDHAIPETVVPGTRSELWQYVDVAALLLALCLATYFALVTRSRNMLLLLTVASVIWFGFVRGGCVCPVGSTQNVALAIFNPSYAVPTAVVAFFALPLVFTLFFGRTFCAAVCPLGAIQELVAVRSVRVPAWLDQSLGLIAYLYLGAAVILAGANTAFIICRYDPFVAFFRFSGNANMLIFGGCLLLIGVFVGRPYCRYLCPYGAMLRVLSRVSKWRVRIPPESCIHCRLCEDVCPYDAIQTPTLPQSTTQRAAGKRRFVVMLAAAPVLVGLLGWLGTSLAEPLSRWHPEVRLAEQLRKEELGVAAATTDASEAFRNAGRPLREAYATAIQWRDRYSKLGGWLGAWTGLVVGAKLVQLTLRRRRLDYQPDRAGCVSCGRCFWYCPVEQVRLGLIEDVGEMVPESPA